MMSARIKQSFSTQFARSGRLEPTSSGHCGLRGVWAEADFSALRSASRSCLKYPSQSMSGLRLIVGAYYPAGRFQGGKAMKSPASKRLTPPKTETRIGKLIFVSG